MKICFLLGSERSGTHLLRSLLHQVPGVRAPGEICNASTGHVRNEETSYFRYRERACREDQDFYYPTQEIQTRLVDRFLESVRKTAAGATLVVLDIKYAHVHNFNAAWADMVLRPLLLEYAEKRQIDIIHLVREKVYQTAISQIYSRASGVWRARRREEIRHLTIAIDRTELEEKVDRLVRNIGAFDRWLAPQRHIRLTYEQLVSDPRPTLLKLNKFLGLRSKIPDTSRFVKTTPPYEESIIDFAELCELVHLQLGDLAQEKPVFAGR